eukprot:jgi/Mesvir1/234/Mv13577-RA.1
MPVSMDGAPSRAFRRHALSLLVVFCVVGSSMAARIPWATTTVPTNNQQDHALIMESTVTYAKETGSVVLANETASRIQSANRRLLLAEPEVCPNAVVTLFSRINYEGPSVSFGCSSSDLSLMLCFPVASIALRKGATMALYSHLGFTGSKLVFQNSEPNIFSDYPRKYSFSKSMAVCAAAVEDPINDCPTEASASLRICPEEKPIGDVMDIDKSTITHHDSKFRFALGGQVVLKYMRPRHMYWYSTGPEPCFYKTIVREAQQGCLPEKHLAFQQLVQEFVPHYYGVIKNHDYLGGEWVVIKNVGFGIKNPSVLDLDPGFAKCTRCGIDVKNYRTYMEKTGTYKVLRREEIQHKREISSNKRRTVMHEVADFFFDGRIRKDMAGAMLPMLERMHSLLVQNRRASFPDSSILMVYGPDDKTGRPKNSLWLIDFGQVTRVDAGKGDFVQPPQFDMMPPGYEGMNDPEEKSNAGRDERTFACGVLELSMHLQDFSNSGKMRNDRCLAPCLKC